MNEPRVEGIAIIGATGRFPGAGSVEEFWANLSAGRETISVFTDEELAASGLDVEALKGEPGTTFPHAGCSRIPTVSMLAFLASIPTKPR